MSEVEGEILSPAFIIKRARLFLAHANIYEVVSVILISGRKSR